MYSWSSLPGLWSGMPVKSLPLMDLKREGRVNS